MESQIEEFLEQFKLSSAKVMEEYEMKRSSYSGLSMTEDATTAGKSSDVRISKSSPFNILAVHQVKLEFYNGTIIFRKR
ncbi:hypothetical protein M8J76_007328 [Diaphorina citri]|nr:hypothetical protein M8J75_009013 [Diaphorina citri]KAI5749439.1 hypothetical protein M8J76_007328 [Diaphorina citri]